MSILADFDVFLPSRLTTQQPPENTMSKLLSGKNFKADGAGSKSWRGIKVFAHLEEVKVERFNSDAAVAARTGRNNLSERT